VFERFTDRARRVLVLAQEESSLLSHGFIAGREWGAGMASILQWPLRSAPCHRWWLL